MPNNTLPTQSPPAPNAPEAETDLLLALTAIPTAAGREHRVTAFLDAWLEARPHLTKRTDPHGNIEVAIKDASTEEPPIYYTAHLDHPAFIVERVIAPGLLELDFRGGVMDDYFNNARIEIIDQQNTRHPATITGKGDRTDPFKSWTAELDNPEAPEANDITTGDIARWLFPDPEITTEQLHTGEQGKVIHTHACDDLAAAAAMMAALDRVTNAQTRAQTNASSTHPDLRLLFTRAEEIGFIGAIAAARDAFIPKDARVIALENSRAFPTDSPIGGGPIVRVGDRLSTFSPSLTAAISKVAEDTFNRPANPTASQKNADTNTAETKPWQRKLMAGGACEASVFCHAGYDATCVCLPLGNYHNMADLTAVQAGTNTTPPTPAREFVAISDYLGMIDLLEACAKPNALRPGGSLNERLDKLWQDRKFVLTEHSAR